MGKIVKYGAEILPKDLLAKEIVETIEEAANWIEDTEIKGKRHEFIQVIFLPRRLAQVSKSSIFFLLREIDEMD